LEKQVKAYEPEGPYIIKSGKREGKSLEVLMFNDYSFLRWHLSKIRKARKGNQPMNDYQKHLEWLMIQAESRTPEMMCPICGNRKVKYFSVRYSRGTRRFSVSSNFTVCDSKECQNRIKAGAFGDPIQFLRPKFSNIPKISKLKCEQKRITDLYREMFGLTGRLTRSKAFEFFKK
jgi:hypothetical protein